MIASWEKGSTWEYRKRRMFVLIRDRWICQLCKEPIDKTARFPHPRSATVHHLKGKRYGDQLSQMVAAHWTCNRAIGEPDSHGQNADPKPKVRTLW